MASISTTDFPTARGVPTAIPSAKPALSEEIPPLEQGDHLTRAEFERRYDAMEELKKAELIEGVVHMPSPVRFSQHASPHASVIGWISTYQAYTQGVVSGGNASLRFDNDNMPQPDALLLIVPNCGGQAIIDGDGYIEGAPELIAEIAASTASIDRHSKLQVYRRSGVREYIIWRVLDGAVDWFVLREGQYVSLPAGENGVVRSETFPGLWLNVPAMLEGKLDVVLATLQLGIATPEHKQFVERLAAQRAEREQTK
jgi:Uma2 family endonuclease